MQTGSDQTYTRSVGQQSIERAQLDQAANYDRNAEEIEFNAGDRDWLHTPQVKPGLTSKLAHLLHGPFPIVRKPSSVNVEIEEGHVERLLYM